MIGAHISTIEAEFSVRSVRRLYNVTLGIYAASSVQASIEASSVRSSSQLVPDEK
jgi:hypothetical protein